MQPSVSVSPREFAERQQRREGGGIGVDRKENTNVLGYRDVKDAKLSGWNRAVG